MVVVSGATMGQTAGGNHAGPGAAGPFLQDPANDAIDRVGGPEQHAGPNALLGPPADHPFRRRQLGGGQLGGAPGELIRRGAEARA